MPRNSAPIISPLFRYVRYNEDQRLFFVHDPTKNTSVIYHPCQVRLFLLFDHNLRNGIEVDTPPASYLEFANVVNMEPDILGALSVVTDGKDWDLPAIPLSRKDMDLSTFAVDGGIIDPDLDALGFYKNGHLDMDQVNHHVRLALDRLRRYDNKGSRNRRVNDFGETGPSRNNRRGQGFNPFKVTTRASHTPTITPMAPINEPSIAQPVPAEAPTSIASSSAPASASAASTSTPASAPAPAASTSVTTRKAAAVRSKDKKGTNTEDAIMGDASAA